MDPSKPEEYPAADSRRRQFNRKKYSKIDRQTDQQLGKFCERQTDQQLGKFSRSRQRDLWTDRQIRSRGEEGKNVRKKGYENVNKKGAKNVRKKGDENVKKKGGDNVRIKELIM